ncbi:MAG: PIN domain-containing protein [Candidatus Korobacteraceae bacterium]|jgi:predicted nucleic acid-binding protein
MAVLLDTNILLRLLQPHHPHCPIAERALVTLRGRGEVLHLAAQNLVEFWAAITRPVDENGLGLITKQAMAEDDALKRLFILLPEVPIQEEWERLVVVYRVSGKNTHDARLVAAMITHRVGSVLTFNVQDFTRYREITAIDPTTLG